MSRDEPPFPKTLGECRERMPDGRCHFVRCRLNLMIDVMPTGTLMLVMPGSDRTIAEKDSAANGVTAAEFDRAADRLVDHWHEVGWPTCADWWSQASVQEAQALLGGGQLRSGNDGLTLDQVGRLLQITRERARQIETRGLVMLGPAARSAGFERAERATVAHRVSSPKTVAQPAEPQGDSDEDDDGGEVGDCGDDTRQSVDASQVAG